MLLALICFEELIYFFIMIEIFILWKGKKIKKSLGLIFLIYLLKSANYWWLICLYGKINEKYKGEKTEELPDWEIALVGHSVGTILLNEIVRNFWSRELSSSHTLPDKILDQININSYTLDVDIWIQIQKKMANQ